MKIGGQFIRLYIALTNLGSLEGFVESMGDELLAAGRMEDLELELNKATEDRDLKRMKRVQKAIGVECKRQGMTPLTDLEKKVLRISEFLHFRDGQPPTDPELHRRVKEEYPKFRHDLKAIKRTRERLGLPASKGKPGPKPK
jgi:hypothetical protein